MSSTETLWMRSTILTQREQKLCLNCRRLEVIRLATISQVPFSDIDLSSGDIPRTTMEVTEIVEALKSTAINEAISAEYETDKLAFDVYKRLSVMRSEKRLVNVKVS